MDYCSLSIHSDCKSVTDRRTCIDQCVVLFHELAEDVNFSAECFRKEKWGLSATFGLAKKMQVGRFDFYSAFVPK